MGAGLGERYTFSSDVLVRCRNTQSSMTRVKSCLVHRFPTPTAANNCWPEFSIFDFQYPMGPSSQPDLSLVTGHWVLMI